MQYVFEVCPKGQLAGMNVELGKALGRPVVAGSKRQVRLAEGPKQRGRKINPNSKRQLRLAALEMKRQANGGVMPMGRPKQVEIEVELS